jgi:hypothetical protein
MCFAEFLQSISHFVGRIPIELTGGRKHLWTTHSLAGKDADFRERVLVLPNPDEHRT